MKKLFIMGGTGFMGRNLKEQLASRYSVFAPSHAELELLYEDKVRDYLETHHFDVIIHTAIPYLSMHLNALTFIVYAFQ